MCSNISLLRTETYGLQEATVSNDLTIIKAKMLFLERENIGIGAQLEENHAIMETHVRKNIIRVERLIGELVIRGSDLAHRRERAIFKKLLLETEMKA
ncbi:hypothetical protein AVEN_80764-1 [Araneus ventricosus]|uniref:Uncharacterized protein n=1 Tax=Araneus ventricosus TaxID=182803 RepID=A0A4Y2I3D8_ARAVE|nr:hypothetical protein AVEN_80764-1 [Araneus ventricosus]